MTSARPCLALPYVLPLLPEHEKIGLARQKETIPSNLQGRQRHKRSDTAHYRGTLLKAVPGGAVRVDRGVKRRSVRAKRVKKIFWHVFLAMRKRSRSIKMAVLGKKRPWLLWSFNGTTRTRNGCHC